MPIAASQKENGMNTCKTCQWWQDDTEAHRRRSNVKNCTCPKVIFATVDYESDAAVAEEDPHHVLSGNEAGVEDGSGYFARLITGPDFGCIHHQPKEPPMPSDRAAEHIERLRNGDITPEEIVESCKWDRSERVPHPRGEPSLWCLLFHSWRLWRIGWFPPIKISSEGIEELANCPKCNIWWTSRIPNE